MEYLNFIKVYQKIINVKLQMNVLKDIIVINSLNVNENQIFIVMMFITIVQ